RSWSISSAILASSFWRSASTRSCFSLIGFLSSGSWARRTDPRVSARAAVRSGRIPLLLFSAAGLLDPPVDVFLGFLEFARDADDFLVAGPLVEVVEGL